MNFAISTRISADCTLMDRGWNTAQPLQLYAGPPPGQPDCNDDVSIFRAEGLLLLLLLAITLIYRRK